MKKICYLRLEDYFMFFATKLLKKRQTPINLLKVQNDSFKSFLKHEIKTPVLAQMRAIELLLAGNMGNLNREQREILEMTLSSCKYSYRMIKSFLICVNKSFN